MSTELGTFNITYEDIEFFKGNGWDLSAESSDVTDLIETESDILELALTTRNLVETVANSDNKGYRIAKRIIILRVTAQLEMNYSQDFSPLPEQRIKQADRLERMLIKWAESVPDSLDTDEHFGGFDYATLEETLQESAASGAKYFGK